VPDSSGLFSTKCPFCGNPISPAFSNDKTEDIGDVVRRIVALQGPGIIADKIFLGLVSDFASDFPKERKWIIAAVAELEIGKRFYDAHVSKNPNDRAAAINVAYQSLKGQGSSGDEMAKFIINCFSHGLGWNIDCSALPLAVDEKSVEIVVRDSAGSLHDQDKNPIIPSSFQGKANVVADAIKRIMDHRGHSVILSRKFPEMLTEYAADFPKERRWITSAISDLGLGKHFLEAHQSENPSDRSTAIIVALRRLKEEDGASEEKAAFIVNCFTYALGWNADASGLPEAKPKAAVRNDPAGRLYEQGMKFFIDGPDRNYSEAYKLFLQASNKGSASAQCRLGVMCRDGLYYEKNFGEALQWFKKSAHQGYAEAQFLLGECYESGLGIDKNRSEAVSLFRKSADQGYAPAQIKLGSCYSLGSGVGIDLNEAVRWYRKAAEQGNADGQNSLAIMYRDGTGIEQNPYEAAKLFRKAADQGHPVAQVNLGFCYANGFGVSKDLYEAARWYRKAAEQGDAVGKYNLDAMSRDKRGM
jgi:TPR repeat protein